MFACKHQNLFPGEFDSWDIANELSGYLKKAPNLTNIMVKMSVVFFVYFSGVFDTQDIWVLCAHI